MELPFREVYKCSWLKLPNNEKKLASIPKQWVIFCVHNDTTPFLEVYTDEKMALTHKPNVSYQLTNLLHITPSICPHDDDEYEFVITFPSEMVRLTASSQHQMMSWVKRLNAKLREMKLLAPSENLYTSHLPDNKSHLLPTRDPNSPLPLPPAVPYIPPGVEPVSASSAENSDGPNNRTSETENSILDENPRNARVSSQNPSTNVQPSTSSLEVPVSPIDGASTSHNRHCESSDLNDSNRTASNNVTVIEVSSTPNGNVFSFNGINDELHDIERSSGEVTNVAVMPINTDNFPIIRRPANIDCPEERIVQNADNRNTNEEPSSTGAVDRTHENGTENTQNINTNLYEHVFLPTSSQIALSNQSTSNSCVSTPLSPIATENKLHSPINSVNLQHSSTPSQLPKMGRGRGNVRGRRRSNSNSEGSSTHPVLAADRIRTAGPMLNQNQRLAPAPHPFVRQVNSEDSGSTRITLREQQVMQLRREMSHPGGVRLQLRRKDCLNSIALIDAFQAVWVAGWKQKEHPMLYTALHIGDQLISLGGKMINNAADAQKLIRAWPSLYIEFVIRRIPCGRVYALRKEQEGQNLGIVQENNTAEIKEIVPKSIIAAQGLTSRVRTMNGLSWTTWYITEINGRPLNLFFKDNEVRDRLNSVGSDISLLVQPSDLIKQIKKQLKLVKNHKEYILQ